MMKDLYINIYFTYNMSSEAARSLVRPTLNRVWTFFLEEPMKPLALLGEVCSARDFWQRFEQHKVSSLGTGSCLSICLKGMRPQASDPAISEGGQLRIQNQELPDPRQDYKLWVDITTAIVAEHFENFRSLCAVSFHKQERHNTVIVWLSTRLLSTVQSVHDELLEIVARAEQYNISFHHIENTPSPEKIAEASPSHRRTNTALPPAFEPHWVPTAELIAGNVRGRHEQRAKHTQPRARSQGQSKDFLTSTTTYRSKSRQADDLSLPVSPLFLMGKEMGGVSRRCPKDTRPRSDGEGVVGSGSKRLSPPNASMCAPVAEFKFEIPLTYMSLRADAPAFVPQSVGTVEEYTFDNTRGAPLDDYDVPYDTSVNGGGHAPTPYWVDENGTPMVGPWGGYFPYDEYGQPLPYGGSPQPNPEAAFYQDPHATGAPRFPKPKGKKKKPVLKRKAAAASAKGVTAAPVTELPHSGTLEPKALLSEDSVFMAALRKLSGASLPHIKFDQRYGRKGVAASALPQFILAPVVVNYRPVHFHDLTPGDLLEYHYDLALVLQQVGSAHTVAILFGTDWKQFSAPYAFLYCKNYAEEVTRLVPSAEPNCRVEFVYDDDQLRDVSHLMYEIDDLAFLREISLYQAMAMRCDLMALYEACYVYFEDSFTNYEVQFRDIFSIPSKIIIKTSGDIVQKLPKGFLVAEKSIAWLALPRVDVTFSSTQAKPANGLVAAPLEVAVPKTSSLTAASGTTSELIKGGKGGGATSAVATPIQEGGTKSTVEKRAPIVRGSSWVRKGCLALAVVLVGVSFFLRGRPKKKI